jgi:hypothetical protein
MHVVERFHAGGAPNNQGLNRQRNRAETTEFIGPYSLPSNGAFCENLIDLLTRKTEKELARA